MFRPFIRYLMRVGAYDLQSGSAGLSTGIGYDSDSKNKKSKILNSITAVALACTCALPLTAPSFAQAQSVGEKLFAESDLATDAQLLLESDELIYDDAKQTVSAVGNVQIAYGDYTLVAERVTYDRGTGRVLAVGNVEIVEPNGNRVFAEEIDVTDNFQDGFVTALRVETPDNTRFAAEGAERRDGEIAEFINGVYTACEKCKEDPTKPPLWQIRADRVIINSKTRRVEYEGASFELFGKPIAYVSKFSHADPSIKRATGFLFPSFGYDSKLGYSGKASYFWAIAPNYDLTLSGTYYNKQGFLADVEWRHKTELGEYNLRYAGINQQARDEFVAGTFDAIEEDRQAIMSTGKFTINPRWKFGWNALYQTDKNFARTYELEDYNDSEITNEVYLTGLNGKNYFDLKAQQFLKQYLSGTSQEQQAKVLPSFDYNIVSDDELANGQISLDVNVASLRRENADIRNLGMNAPIDIERHNGIVGNSTRASAELEWKNSRILQGGAVVTTSLSGRADGVWLNTDNLNSATNPLLSNDSILRTMPAAMLEIRYPLVADDGLVSQIFEPIAQIIVRPDETHIGEMPNEDAQSFVFDTTNLFERDKFSGFDRVEGGTRANVGFRYSAAMAGGANINIVAGQSFHLGGQNSFAQRDVVNAGLDSGLETKRSDYVAAVNLNTGSGISFGAAGRFDEKDAELKRGEVSARYIDTAIAAQASYIFIDEQPQYGFSEDRHEISGSTSLKLNDEWRVFASGKYDLKNDTLYSRSVGVSYDDSCFSFSIAYSNTDDRYSNDATEESINFSLGLRTLGSFEHKRNLLDEE